MTTDATTNAALSAVEPAASTLITIEQELNAMFLEREQAIREIFVCLLARQHCVLIGDPGTGKSALVEEICARVSDPQGNGLQLFTYLMTKFTQVEEIFGPVSFAGIKNETYHRVIAGRLPEAEIAFLDEIWKPTSAILNTLLKIINERRFNNGVDIIDVPLMCMYGASNELPEGNDLGAIRDRFLLTHFVGHLSRSNRELLMLRKAGLEPDPWKSPKTRIGRDELLALQEYILTIPFTRPVIAAKAAIVDELTKEGIVISERRDGQCQPLMQAHALLEGRDAVNEDDLVILYDAFWMEPGQIPTVTRVINQHSNPTNARASELKDQADTIYAQTLATMEAIKQDRSKRLLAASEGAGKLEAIKQELEDLQNQAQRSNTSTKRVEQAVVSVSKQYADLLTNVGFKGLKA